MSVASLTPRVREALGVSSSYDDESIPALLRRCIQQLLRDYHFPKSLRKIVYTELADAQQAFELPLGFKLDVGAHWHDPVSKTWSDPLQKSAGFRRPYPETLARYYWLQGTQLMIDTPVSIPAMNGYQLEFFYESSLVETVGDNAGNEDWFTTDFEDVVFYSAVTTGAAEYRKPEVSQTFSPLWQAKITSLAIYTNELEWGNVEMLMRAPRDQRSERYPRS